MLVRRDAFERAGGFDTAYLNSLEDTDLCMRLGELGLEVRYCPESVVHHLESVSRGRRSSEIAANTRVFKERWQGKAERDDLRYYIEDGLMRIHYHELYPLRIELAPELAIAASLDPGAFVELQSQQVADLLRETVRLTAHVADLELGTGGPGPGPGQAARPARGESRGSDGLAGLVADAERLQLDIHAFQAAIAEALRNASPAPNGGRPQFVPGDRLAYLELKERIRPVIEATVPPGATVLVVSRGDESLLELEGRHALHFPQEADGAYAGHHPADSAEAIVQLERLRKLGAGYLAVPETDAWWLDHYEDLARHLTDHYQALTHETAPCRVFRLAEATGS
jgi:hypothetical protein